MDNMTLEQYIGRLKGLLEKKKALLLDVLSLTQAQTEAITDEGMEGLDKLINDKQWIIDGINKLDEAFETDYQSLKSLLGITQTEQLDVAKLEGSALESARQLKALTAEILNIVRDISEREKVNSEKSNKLLEQYGNEIKKLNQGKKANNAYKAASSSAPSYFLDKKK